MRWRVRALMVVVAIAAMVMGAAIGLYAERRRSYYRSRVESLAWGEIDVVERIGERLQAAREAEDRGPEGREEAEAARAEAEWLAKVAVWHVKLERSYMRAVERPWESLPPDPSPPPPPPGFVRNKTTVKRLDQ